MRNRTTLGVAALVSLTTTVALAQESADKAASGPNLEEVVVTGSSIRGVTTPGSPVISLGRDQIVATGLATSSDLARALPQVINLGADESRLAGAQDAAANTTRVSGINLRGIGNEATLLLINGRRLAPAGVIKSIYDPNVIPASAVERLEVVVDGASAIYGSDAVAGVVNVITRKDFTGAETLVRYGTADGTDQTIFSQNFGYAWGSGSVFGAYEHNERGRLAGVDREFSTADRRARGGSDARSQLASPGNIVGTGTTRYPLPNGNGIGIPPASLVAGAPNRFDDGSFPDLLPSQKRDTFFLDARQEFGGFTAWYQGWYSKRDFDERVSPASGTLRVPNTNPYFVAPTALNNPTFVNVEYRFMAEDVDPRLIGYENAQQNAVGLTYDVGRWRIEGYGNLSENRGYQRRGAITNGPALTAALNSTVPATAFNAFGNGTFNMSNNAALMDIIIANRDTYGTSEARDLGLKADGPIFSLPGGDVRVAAGAERHDNEFNQRLDATNTIASGAVATKTVLNRRHNTSLFTEVYIPVVGSSNSVPGIAALNVSAAVRHEDYSDFGETTDPKYGLTYNPIETLTLRGTYGTSFRAPSLVDTSEQIHNIFIQNLTDPTSGTGTTRGIFHNGGRSTLQPEEAETWSFGIDWRPDGALAGLSTSATYYKVDYTNRIDVVPNTALTNPVVFAPFIVRRPPASDVAGNAAFNALAASLLCAPGVVPCAAHPDLQSPLEAVTAMNAIVDGRRANVGSTKQEGIDFDISYAFDSSFGNWFTGLTVAKILDLTRATAPNTPLVDVLDTFGNPVDLRARASLGWKLNGFSANAYVNYVDGYRNTAITPNKDVGSYHTVDLSLGYEFGSGIVEGLSLTLAAQDLLDETPPVVLNGIYSWDNQNVSPLGRMVSAIVTMKW